MNKVVDSLGDAVAGVFSGATVLVGGFGGCGDPFNLMNALLKLGVKDLTIVGTGPAEWGPFVENGLAARIISGFTSHPFRPEITSRIESLVQVGKLEVETVPHGVLEERIRAGGAGIPGFYSPVGIGTPLEAGKEKRTIHGQEYLLEYALKADFALVKACQGDRFGNLVCRLAAGNRNVAMATAARVTIAEVEEVVEIGQLDPNRIDIPGIFVHRLVKAPKIVKWMVKKEL